MLVTRTDKLIPEVHSNSCDTLFTSESFGRLPDPFQVERPEVARELPSPPVFGLKPSPDAARANNLVGGHDARKR